MHDPDDDDDERELTAEERHQQLIERHHQIIQNETRKADLLAIGTFNNLMQSAETERLRFDAAAEWLSHRRKIEEAALKIQADRENNNNRVRISFNADALLKETDNVRAIRDAFGVSIQPSEDDSR
jgi:hypothetical protein